MAMMSQKATMILFSPINMAGMAELASHVSYGHSIEC